MKIVIVEDEPNAVERLKALIKALKPEAKVIASLDSVSKAVEWFRNNVSFDLVLMDIQLSDGLSFDIFKEVEVKSPVIFITAFDEYALRAFKVNSIDYILKPIDSEELNRAFKKYESMVGRTDSRTMFSSIEQAMAMLTKKYKERFVIKVGEHLRSIETKDVLYFSSSEKATFCHTKDGRQHILDFTLDQLESLVDPLQFFRINRGYIVGIGSIHDMVSHVNSRLKLVLKTSDDSDIIVARERVQQFKNWLDR